MRMDDGDNDHRLEQVAQLAGEPPDEACIALLHFLRSAGLDVVQQSMLIADYAAKRGFLSRHVRAGMDDDVFNSYTPPVKALLPLQERATPSNESNMLDDVGPIGVLGDADGISPPGRSGSAGEIGRARAFGPATKVFASNERRAIPADVVLVASAGIQLRAVRDVFKPSPLEPVGGRRAYRSTVPCPNIERGLVVVVLPAGGFEDRSLDVDVEMLKQCDPGAVFLVGTAIGNRNRVKRGDVVVPREIASWDGGSDLPGPKLAVPADMAFNLDFYDTSSPTYRRELKTFSKKLPKADCPPHLSPNHEAKTFLNASLASSSGPAPPGAKGAGSWPRNGNKIVHTLDHDSWGFATAVAGRWWSVWKGVVGYEDSDQDVRWERFATTAAALCLKDFLQTEYVPPQAREL